MEHPKTVQKWYFQFKPNIITLTIFWEKENSLLVKNHCNLTWGLRTNLCTCCELGGILFPLEISCVYKYEYSTHIRVNKTNDFFTDHIWILWLKHYFDVSFQVLCGRYVNQHMVTHRQESGHPIVLSFADLSVWCYACESYVHNKVCAARSQACNLLNDQWLHVNVVYIMKFIKL